MSVAHSHPPSHYIGNVCDSSVTKQVDPNSDSEAMVSDPPKLPQHNSEASPRMPPRGAPYEQSTDQHETHLARPEPPQTERTLSKGPTEFQERPGGTQDEPRWAQRELTKAQDGRVGLKMGPTWPKMRQHGPKGSLTWPRKAPRSGQDGQVGAKMEPTWPQDGPRCANMGPKGA